jgi:hypothetical protein
MMTDKQVNALIGLDVVEARRRVEAKGWHFRVLTEDGVGHLATTDLRDDRVNVTVRRGKVEQADVG